MAKKSDDSIPYTSGIKRSFYTRCVKDVMDRLAAGICLVVFSPILLLLWLLVMLADGRPALFSQERLGKGGRTFRMYKFRTMKVGSDSSFVLNPDGSLRTSEDDPRITRLGRVLRRYSLDELPQLINVLKGDMSLVGPRPDLPFHAQLYTQEERRKLDLKPGITGLAQVCGRNNLPWKERLRLDIEYVNRVSLWLDLSIVARTLVKVVASEGIYAEPAKSIKALEGGSRNVSG
ncbi:MAG TPA: sugar transferase [Clostridia bacterium]|nr:sugar transferase [Clostridia bacterium]